MTGDTLTLVTGGTGETGRRVAGRLHARGRAVRLGSRAGTPPFDRHDPRTRPAAPGRPATGCAAYARRATESGAWA
ncbi:hypothetical protein GCM10010106_49440 [Thermopolyspora flexuosa]|jgi:nucleoside-diphosphate-sugar epimerase|uniref:NAD-dependent epimerase/dehydratase family protein n=1 Tax=Thermopolyspora flexuosa TaxID=103836 RepID=A0A543IQK2_9ACTN|nr:hypothetical protein [Thermopolyspora flexuosa]TQM72829.1 hypothetical protein FHX40_4990 [Thermopolyspora flexuosa]GGM94849.1 hypothetical protein GCM10010106_49440 [Thermopolyspora flexuosa]